jgi:integrase
MTVRTEKRRGLRRLIIDIYYRDGDGRNQRFRQDAEVQTVAAARAEDTRRMGLLALTGVPFGISDPKQPSITSSEPRTTGKPPAAPLPAEDETPAPTTFAEARKVFDELYATTRLKASTRRGYSIVLQSMLGPRLDNLDLYAIDAGVVRELDRELVKKGLRPATRRNVQCVLRAVLRFAIEQGLADDDLPRMPPLPKVGVTARVAMTDDEVDRVFSAAEQRYVIPLSIAKYAGLRAREVRGLRRRDVDFVRNVIVVRRARCRDIEAPPKSGHERVVPLHPKLREVLEPLKNRPASAYLTGPTPDEPWAEFAISKGFDRACRKAGIEGFHLHDLRHWFVTALFKSGTPAPVVQRLAGHAHLTTTARYSHTSHEDLVAGIDRMR